MSRPRISTGMRQAILVRAQNRCEYCQSRFDYTTETFAVEHVVPVSRGGSNAQENLAFSCSGCNGHKYNKTEAPDPLDGTTVPLFNPRTQIWQEHFCWQGDYAQMIDGLTLTGRATVEALRMNRPGLMHIRQLLYSIGQHPATLKGEINSQP